MRNLNVADQRLALAGRMLGALASTSVSSRPVPRPEPPSRDVSDGVTPIESNGGGAGSENSKDASAGGELTDAQRALSGALMRVNHVGEVCAQALYEGQAMATRSPALRAEFMMAAQEEGDHLHWTRERLRELESRPSLLNPLWYGGALLIGMAAGRLGDPLSLGFMAETERQVERHLSSHLDRLPVGDRGSRAIVSAMKEDESRHAGRAMALGGRKLPWPLSGLMRVAGSVMTTVAHRV